MSLMIVKELTGKTKKIEILCNRFTDALLVPDTDFQKQVASISVSEKSISDLADNYKVSREINLRKFLDKRSIDAAYYTKAVTK